MNLGSLSMLLGSELFSAALHCSYACKNQQHMCANSRGRGIAHKHAGYSLAPDTGFLQTAPTGQRHNFLTLAPWQFFSLLPRELVSSDLSPVCIRKERLYCPARSWYLISLQALGANPTTSVLLVSSFGACVCTHTCQPQPCTGCFLWLALCKKGTGPWLVAGSIAHSQQQLPLFFLQKLFTGFLL